MTNNKKQNARQCIISTNLRQCLRVCKLNAIVVQPGEVNNKQRSERLNACQKFRRTALHVYELFTLTELPLPHAFLWRDLDSFTMVEALSFACMSRLRPTDFWSNCSIAFDPEASAEGELGKPRDKKCNAAYKKRAGEITCDKRILQ